MPPETATSRNRSSKETLDASVRIKGTTLGFGERICGENYLSQLTVSSFDKKGLNSRGAPLTLTYLGLQEA